jgi:adenylate kinase family enzyme
MIGPPGAGKTTYHNKYLLPLGYERIHQDAGSSQAVCLVAAKHLLSKNHSVCFSAPNLISLIV